MVIVKPCTRIEIVIEEQMVDTLVKALMEAGAPGYTLLPQVTGTGDRGSRRGDDLAGDSSNCYCLIACDDEAVVNRILEAVRPLLTRNGGICLASGANWLRH